MLNRTIAFCVSSKTLTYARQEVSTGGIYSSLVEGAVRGTWCTIYGGASRTYYATRRQNRVACHRYKKTERKAVGCTVVQQRHHGPGVARAPLAERCHRLITRSSDHTNILFDVKQSTKRPRHDIVRRPTSNNDTNGLSSNTIIVRSCTNHNHAKNRFDIYTIVLL